uniref:Uncharacterized protein n=1 Tax=Glossina palpalis gambiensis TaxID=67801 RepID=A0A1B0BJH0_9MUSC
MYATAAASSAAELPGPVRGIPPTGPLVDGPPAAQVWAREYISVAVPAPPPGAPVGPAELGGIFQAFQLPPPDGPEGPPVEAFAEYVDCMVSDQLSDRPKCEDRSVIRAGH